MSSVSGSGDLQIDQDLRYQRREWSCERIGWAVMAMVVLAAVLGLFGHGPLSNTTVSSPGAELRLDYDRFLRYRSPATLSVHLTKATTQRNEVKLWLNQAYIDGVEITEIAPQPDRVEVGADRHLFVFKVADRGKPTTILFRLQAEQLGALSGRIAVEDGQPLEFGQFVYP